MRLDLERDLNWALRMCLLASLLLVAMPGSPSSFLSLLVVRSGAPCSVLAPSKSQHALQGSSGRGPLVFLKARLTFQGRHVRSCSASILMADLNCVLQAPLQSLQCSKWLVASSSIWARSCVRKSSKDSCNSSQPEGKPCFKVLLQEAASDMRDQVVGPNRAGLLHHGSAW